MFAAAFVFGWLPRRQARASLESEAAKTDGTPRVEVVVPKIGSSDRALTLPGSVTPLEETVVYARANGYVGKWLVDIGDTVKDGAVLAELDTPDLTQQIDQARAQLLPRRKQRSCRRGRTATSRRSRTTATRL